MAETNHNDNPNGFITEREVDGERRSIRHYNDGRVSSRNSSRQGSISSRSTSSASLTRSRVSSRSASPSTTWSTPGASSGGGVGLVELFFEIEDIDIPEHNDSPESEVRPNSSNTNRETETLASHKLVSASSPALLGSNTAKGGHVLDRVAKIENRIRKLAKRPFVDIAKNEK